MSNDLTLYKPENFNLLTSVAKHAHSSGLYAGVGGESKILMILLTAQELGIPPMQALNGGLHNIQGKIEVSARLMMNLIRKAGHSVKFVQCDSKGCILEGKRGDNGETCKASFTMADATAAGLSNRENWKKYPEDMMYSRAISRLGRRLFPDVIGTSYVEGEINPKNEVAGCLDADAEIVSKVEAIPMEQEPEAADPLAEILVCFDQEEHSLLKVYLAHLGKKTSMDVIIEKAIANMEGFKTSFQSWKDEHFVKVG